MKDLGESDRMKSDKPTQSVLDNVHAKMADYLRYHLKDAHTFRLVSAYFSVFGFQSLAEELEKNPSRQVRFLFGSPDSIAETISGKKSQRTFDLTEDGLAVNEVLQQRSLAQRCAAWVDQDNVKVRKMVKSNFMHGKMYHMASGAKPDSGIAATVGSSNFTRGGLGDSQNPNIEINLAVEDPGTLDELEKWFDELWNDNDQTADAKKEVLEALRRCREERSPDFVYYKTLFELFRKELDARKRGEWVEKSNLSESQIWNKLYEFQKDGAKRVIDRLLDRGGCILADSVGLGKTYTALAAIRYFELRNERVLVLCPKKLMDNWRIYQIGAGDANNPFPDDRFYFSLLAHTDLTREKGESGSIKLEDFNWGNFGLVVIDESHNFRNDSKSRRGENGKIIRHSRYEKLLEEVIKSGEKTKVLMLSATPVNTSLIDLRNQIYLLTEGSDDIFARLLGISNIGLVMKKAQEKFHEWEKLGSEERKKDKLLEMLGTDFLRLLGDLTIARSRKQIQRFYSSFIQEQGDFPKHEKPQNEYPHTDAQEKLSYKELYGDLEELELRIYRPSDYVPDKDVERRLAEEKKEHNFNQQAAREESLVAMMRINFLKRLESSAHSCRLTLYRRLEKIDEQIEKIDRYLETSEDQEALDMSDFGEQENEDEDFIVSSGTTQPYKLGELDVRRWRTDMQKDRVRLEVALDKVTTITPERDGKLLLLKEQIRKKVTEPNRKLLVFTAFKDTAEYLYRELKKLADELNINIAMVAGDQTHREPGRNSFSEILNDFSPQARSRKEQGEEIDLLIATDCISEGQNLQDCDAVLNYDIHWNPVRLIQRFGRIDRLGSKNKSVRMINYWPTKDMELYLKLENRVRARMVLADTAATGKDNPLTEAGTTQERMQSELDFRDKQLIHIRDTDIDLDADDSSVGLSDFTLDYFIAQLLRHLEKNRKELEEAPPGIYAVVDMAKADERDGDMQEGVIFCFRHLASEASAMLSPKPPFYMVHVNKDGTIRRGFVQMHAVLRTFESLAAGEREPDNGLCSSFSEEIESEEGKQIYDDLAQAAVKDISKIYKSEALKKVLPPGSGVVPKESDRPSADNLQLVTWAIIKKGGEHHRSA